LGVGLRNNSLNTRFGDWMGKKKVGCSVDPISLTLDTNCIYELESPASAEYLQRMRKLTQRKVITLRFPAIAASERQRTAGRLPNFRIFRERMENLDLGDIELLRPLAYVGMHYVGWAIIVGPENRKVEQRIHEILFPQIAFEASEHCARDDVRGRVQWRNAKCDVLAMWCHVKYAGDIFVTQDRNFLKQSKKPRLEALGARTIASLEQAIRIVGG